MSARIQAKKHPLLVGLLILSLIPIFTFTSTPNSVASSIINSQAELANITDLGGHYVLGADITLIAPASGSNPMFSGNFTGTFDGAGHTISGLTGPLFEAIDGADGTPATVSNLNLVTIENGFEATGILADSLFTYSIIQNVHVKGKVSQQGMDSLLGGLAGRAFSDTSIENSSAVVTLELNVTDPDDCGCESVGGLIAEESGSITNSYAKANISVVGRRNIGGLVGTTFQATIEKSASSGSITAGTAGSNIGGLVGISAGATIDSSYSSVAVSTDTESIVGGLLGRGQNALPRHTEIFNSYATGPVSNQGEKAGGLVGYIDQGLILNCIAEGSVTGIAQVGGLIGYAESSRIHYSRASGDIIGNNRVGGLIGHVNTNNPSLDPSENTVKDSSASGSVSSAGSNVENIGGLIGFVFEAIVLTNISASGSVVARNAKWVGGLIGKSISEITQASASGVVNSIGGDQVGGLVGFTGMDLTHTSSSGAVTGFSDVGKLAGYADANIYHSKSTGRSTVTSATEKNDQLEGNSNRLSLISNTGTTESTGPVSNLLDQLNTSQSSARWAMLPWVNSARPHITALLGLGFYESTVTFKANGGSGSMAVQTGTGVSALSTNAFTRDGYIFEGWALLENGPLVYRDERDYHFQSDLILYAKWEVIVIPVTHTVTYNLGGGSGTLPTQADVAVGSSFTTAASSGLSKAGYTFNKWNNGLIDTAASSPYTMGSSDIILTATWTAMTSPPPVVYIPPPPQPYLSVGAAPTLRKVENLAVCSSGTYYYGVTYFDGTQNSLTKNVSLTAFQYRFFVDGVENKDLGVSSAIGSASIPMSKLSTTGLLTCQVSVEHGGVSINASSKLNDSGIVEADLQRYRDIQKAEFIYQSTLRLNSETKERALIVNRKLWRDSVDRARNTYVSSKLMAKSTKEVVAASKQQSISIAKAATEYKLGIVTVENSLIQANFQAAKEQKDTENNLILAYWKLLELNGYGFSLDSIS